ncbi:MAG: FecR family protein [Spirochaetota bacterium]
MRYMILTLLLTVSLSAAETAVINYQSAYGAIERAGGRTERSSVNAPLSEGDTVRTLASTMVIEFSGGSRLKLTENSAVTLSAIRNERRIALLAGSVFAKVAKLSGGAAFEITTPNVVAAVRGTEFFFGFGREKDLWLCVNEGAVHVASSAAKREQTVKQGEGVFILGGTDITAPKPYGWTKKLNWNMDAEKGDVREKGAIKSAYDMQRKNYD